MFAILLSGVIQIYTGEVGTKTFGMHFKSCTNINKAKGFTQEVTIKHWRTVHELETALLIILVHTDHERTQYMYLNSFAIARVGDSQNDIGVLS